MTDGSQQVDTLELESAINFFYDQFSKQGVTHFDLLGLSHSATHREIEAAFKKYSEEFSPDRIALITNPEVRKKGNFLITRGRAAYETLIDFQKRGAYEKAGFREPSEIVVEDTDEEKARIIYKKAKSLKTMKEYKKAVMAMEEAVKLDTKKPDYYLLLGLCQSQIPDKKRDAEKNLQRAATMEAWNAEPQVA
ncbi:MAG: DnaJ domain-containing protein, partial [Candidatus Aminicenantes bacterium]|nr:DnaJ domain-containing protein [Candidatus Aminicenantes bacterium]